MCSQDLFRNYSLIIVSYLFILFMIESGAWEHQTGGDGMGRQSITKHDGRTFTLIQFNIGLFLGLLKLTCEI